MHHADLAGGARVAVGHVRRALLVADEDVMELRILGERVVGGKDGAAGIPEHQVGTLPSATIPR